MTVVAAMYGKSVIAAYNKEIEWDSVVAGTQVFVSLHTATYVPDQDVDDFWNDATNEVAAGGGYAQYGQLLANPTIGYTAGTNVIKLDGDDTVWTAATITASRAVVYFKNPGANTTWPLICYQSSDTPIVSTGGSWTITWNASGICTITVGAPA